MLHYELSIPRPADQYVHVTLTVREPPGRKLRVAMPAWAPGSYKIRDFARHVYDLEAQRPDGTRVPVTRHDKQSWDVEHGGHAFVLRYRVFANEPTVRTSYVDDRHASLNGTSLFLYLPEHRDRPCELVVEPPAGWDVYTALERVERSEDRVRFVARDYDALADAPLELGTPQTTAFDVGGTRFEYVLTGGADVGADVERLTADARRVVSAFDRAMGGFPMSRYVFLLAITASGGGGLEHDDSTMMMLSRSTFDADDAYTKAAHLAAHEFFHLWNVRRIRDAALRPYDYARENHTALLWFHEGFTEAIEHLILVRAGLVEPKAFLGELAEQWTAYLRKPGRNYAPIDTLSFEAWTKAYQPAENHRNVAVSYYEKGGFLGLALDLELRLRSAARRGEGSLLGVFRRLMKSHGENGRGIVLADIVAAASAEAGEDMGWFFDRYVHGTEEVPLPELLARVGVGVETRAPWQKPGGSAAETDAPPEGLAAKAQAVWTGALLQGIRVADVETGSPAERAGLMRGDEIAAVNERRMADEAAIKRAFARIGPGHEAVVHLFRDGRLVTATLALAEDPHRVYGFELLPAETLDETQRAVRERWLEVFPSE